jgi:heme-degrading monooxygenase HmoA
MANRQRFSRDGKVRVLFLIRLADGAQQRFLDAYESIRHQVARVPGHLLDQVCQSTEDSRQWLITSEWESAEHFLAWERSPEHREMVKPMRDCLEQRESLRFHVVRET